MSRIENLKNAPWPEEHLQMLRDLYPTGGWYAVHLATGRAKYGIAAMAQKKGIKCDPVSVQRLAREAVERRGISFGRPRLTAEEKALRQARKDRRPMARKPVVIAEGLSGEKVDENDYPRRVIVPAATAPRITGRIVASVFDLAEAS